MANPEQEVNRLKGHPNSQLGDFAETRHDGGEISPAQIEENAPDEAPETGGDAPPRNVTTQHGGAKREGYFRDRDYK